LRALQPSDAEKLDACNLPDRPARLHHNQRPKGDAAKMPRRSSGPKLWFDKARDRWTISDGKSKRRTNCRRDEIRAAEKELKAYIAEKHTVEKTSTAIADILMAYIDEVITGKVSEPDSLMMIRRLNAWWGDKFIADITPANCKAYIAHRGGKPIVRSELGYLRAALKHWHKNHSPILIPTITMPDRPPAARALADQIRGGPVPLGSPAHSAPRPVLYYRLVHRIAENRHPEFEMVDDRPRFQDSPPQASGRRADQEASPALPGRWSPAIAHAPLETAGRQRAIADPVRGPEPGQRPKANR
jgi:hypothetical protein